MVREEAGGRGVVEATLQHHPAQDRISKVLSVDFFAAAERRYTEALARRDAIRDAWKAEGSPLLARGSTGQPVPHPFLRMLRDHDLLVDRLGAAVRKRHRGPEPSAVLTP